MSFLHPLASKETFNPPMTAAIVLIHLLALAAPFTFTWPGLIAFSIMYFVTGCLGITLTYHRMLSHRSFKAVRPLKYFLTLCGTLALEGGVLWWVAGHRVHHRESDKQHDLHSPKVSFFWSHVGWLFFKRPQLDNPKDISRFVLDLHNDPGMRFLDRYFLPINLAFAGLLVGIGYMLGGPKTGLSMLVWGGFLRIVAVWHITWFVNSATHVWGYRNYTTTDDSRNNWWVAFLTFGEGWHNNHHADARCAKSGHRWFEFDLTYTIIKGLQAFGLVHSPVPIAHERLARQNRRLNTTAPIVPEREVV